LTTSLESYHWENCLVEKQIVSDNDGRRVPFNLITPYHTECSKLPFLLCTHGATSSKHEWTELDGYTKGGNFTREIVKHGIAIVAPDLHYHGDNHTADLNGRNVFLEEHFDDFFNCTIEDLNLLIHHLFTDSHFDISRMGFAGYSLAGIFGFYLANRGAPFKTMMLCVPGVNRAKNRYYSTFNNIDNLDKNISLLHINAENDEYVNFEESIWLFNTIPLVDKKIVSFKSGHSLPYEYVPKAVEWIVSRL
jgi:esterase/lipase